MYLYELDVSSMNNAQHKSSLVYMNEHLFGTFVQQTSFKTQEKKMQATQRSTPTMSSYWDGMFSELIHIEN